MYINFFVFPVHIPFFRHHCMIFSFFCVVLLLNLIDIVTFYTLFKHFFVHTKFLQLNLTHSFVYISMLYHL